MDITTQYAIGDVTYVVVNEKVMTHVTCAICNSTGVVTLGGVEFRCPACGGRMEASGERVDVVRQFTISSAVVVKTDTPDVDDVVYGGRLEDGRTFQTVEAKVFATEADAQASIGG